jgi:uncharacterized glyoxalase superfamily protein PhnB
MANQVKRVPDGFHTITPHLVVRGAVEAIAFYKKAFGALEMGCHLDPAGKVMHAMMQIGNSRFFLNDEFPNMGALSPQSLNGTPVTLSLYVEDVDSLYAQATKAGAKVVMPLADQFWGDRYGIVADPFGHQWALASHVKDFSPEEMKKSAEAAFASAGEGCAH